MHVRNHKLHTDQGEPVATARSPNQGGALVPRYLVMHYTAGGSAESSIRHLTKKAAKASAHLVIGRDGGITQLVPFNRVAWHAGRSRWQGLTGLNQHSIGIELDNAGPLEGGAGQWRSWFERHYPDEEVAVAAHKFDDVERGWHRYTEAQLAAALEAAQAIVAHYGLTDVLGHDDIAPERKRDPGPAFPMESFRGHLIGRADDDFERFVTTAELNIREGPGVRFAKLDASPLAKGTRLSGESRDGSWHFVEVLGENDEPEATGWVHGNFIAPA
jgi:N-acetylmuramoyl-L-alanine amidase